MATSSGQATNAVYGFTHMLINLLKDQRPRRLAVAFDLPGKTFRHDLDEEYKATRKKPPDLFISQLELIRDVLDALGMTVLGVAGVEADDILATVASQARDSGMKVVVVTGDRDVFQLVEDPYVSVMLTRRGVSEYSVYDEAGIKQHTGVRPADYVEYAALRGDASDNLPGVPKVGEKTAAVLINDCGGIDGVYERIAEHPPARRKALVENEPRVRLNVEMMTLRRDVELPVSVDDLFFEPDVERVRELFGFLEFNRLIERLGEVVGDFGEGGGTKPVLATVLDTSDSGEAAGLLAEASAKGGPTSIGFAPNPEKRHSPPPGLAVAMEGRDEVLWLGEEMLATPEVARALADLLGPEGPPLCAHDSKEGVVSLLCAGLDVRSLRMDTAIAAYLLNPSRPPHSVKEMLERYTEFHIPDELPGQEAAPAEQLSLGGVGGGEAPTLGLDGSERSEAEKRDVATATLACSLAAAGLRKALASAGMEDLHDKVEIPLVRVLAKMEHRGIGVDLPGLRALTAKLRERAEALRERVLAEAGGEEFNLNSPKQLGKVLFGKLKLTPTKKTRTGAYSTDARELEKMRGEHPVIEHLLEYREAAKLFSTYGQGLQNEVNPATGRIHATFNQTVARTGRLSSDAPNLHNIPVRTDLGKEFRGVFVAEPGCGLLVADYNQVELRCIAHLSGDSGMLAAFADGADIHEATAARIFGLEPSEVTSEARSVAKMVSYGLTYGMEAYGLSQRLRIPTEEAQEILDAYFGAFTGVRDYMQAAVAEARERGYTETLYGRRRFIPELRSENARIRQAAERQAMNAGIQGLAADIFKVALVNIDRSLEEGGLLSRIILQVHDEVILEVPEGEAEAAGELVLREMEGACNLRVPLIVDMSFGGTWLDAKN